MDQKELLVSAIQVKMYEQILAKIFIMGNWTRQSEYGQLGILTGCNDYKRQVSCQRKIDINTIIESTVYKSWIIVAKI